MKITFIQHEDLPCFDILVERQKGQYNNIYETLSFTPEQINDLSKDELFTLGWSRIKPLAIRVFEAIEPLDEEDTPINFKLIPPREVSFEVFTPNETYINSEVSATRQAKDQYGTITQTYVPIDTSKLGPVEVLGKTVNIIPYPTPEPSLEDYLIDLDFRMSKIELGV